MQERVRQTIEKFNMLVSGDTVIAAFSGGPDSTALMIILAQIAQKMDLKVVAAHFNHGLRGNQSDADEHFCWKLAGELGIVFVAGQMDLGLQKKGDSPEEFYRRQRYLFLSNVAREYRADKIALGHHLQDQAETVLLNLLRGSGLQGLKGMLPVCDGKWIRPLLEVTQQEIILFLNNAGITFCQDITNENTLFLRNKIRAELIPYLKNNYNPQIEKNLAQMAEILRQEDSFIVKTLEEMLLSPNIQIQDGKIVFSTKYLCTLHPGIRTRLLKRLLEHFSSEKNGFDFKHVSLLDKLTQNKQSGKTISLPLGIIARLEYENMILEYKSNAVKPPQYQYEAVPPCSLHIKETGLHVCFKVVSRENIDYNSQNRYYFDTDKIIFPLWLRNKKSGDWIQRMGMQGRQTIKNLFINQKIPISERRRSLLLVDQQSVIWVEQGQISDRVKIQPETKRILMLEVNRNEKD